MLGPNLNQIWFAELLAQDLQLWIWDTSHVSHMVLPLGPMTTGVSPRSRLVLTGIDPTIMFLLQLSSLECPAGIRSNVLHLARRLLQAGSSSTQYPGPAPAPGPAGSNDAQPDVPQFPFLPLYNGVPWPHHRNIVKYCKPVNA